MAHTPGPWDYDKDSKEVFSCSVGYLMGWIALVKGNADYVKNIPEQERLANARLIAAAPELLTALRSVSEDLHSLDMDTNGWRDMDATAVDQLIAGALRRADDAIAKATGKESE